MYPEYDQYGRPYYPEPMPDQLAQMRQQRQYQPVREPDPGILWTQGEAGAKAHKVGPGNTVLLMDSEQDVFYIKSVDYSGMPQPLRTFDYKERTAPRAVPQAAIQGGEEFLTRREFLAFLEQFQESEHKPKFAKEE